MSESGEALERPTRIVTRREALLGSSLALATGVAGTLSSSNSARATTNEQHSFHGVHQAGITTKVQNYLSFATFDVVTNDRRELARLLRGWSDAAASLVDARPLPGTNIPSYPPSDTGETFDLGPAGLTVTFGFGPSLFDHRFGLHRLRPQALVELPRFPGDRLDPLRTGGDLCVQSCAEDPMVAFHAVRNLTRLGEGVVSLRNIQFGSGPTSTSSQHEGTPRNLLGFKDGTNNLVGDDSAQMQEHVWVGKEGDQSWMRGGTYLVARRIRVALEEWSSLSLNTQQGVIGRFRNSGAPLTGRHEHDSLDFNKLDVQRNPIIPVNAHARVASATLNNGAVILRRGFNFADGVDTRTGELDAGLMFICFQRDVRTQFIALQNNLATQDALSNYTVHTGSGVFACPPGTGPGGWIGEGLLA